MVTENDIGKTVYIINEKGKIINGILRSFDNFFNICNILISGWICNYYPQNVFCDKKSAFKSLISKMQELKLDKNEYKYLLKNHNNANAKTELQNRNFCYFFHGFCNFGIGVLLSEFSYFNNDLYCCVLDINSGYTMAIKKKNLYKTKEEAIQFVLRKLKENEPFME